MMKYPLTVEDAVKLKKAYDDLSQIIELVEERNRETGEKRHASSFVTHAHQCLEEVLYGID